MSISVEKLRQVIEQLESLDGPTAISFDPETNHIEKQGLNELTDENVTDEKFDALIARAQQKGRVLVLISDTGGLIYW